MDSSVREAEMNFLSSGRPFTLLMPVVTSCQRAPVSFMLLVTRSVLALSWLRGKVIAVLHGHRHEGAFSTIKGIPYFTFKALVEGAGPWNSSYSIVDVMPDLSVRVLGYRNAEWRSFSAR